VLEKISLSTTVQASREGVGCKLPKTRLQNQARATAVKLCHADWLVHTPTGGELHEMFQAFASSAMESDRDPS
jgi:hypothetical protein